jgi:hypothetical protein
MNSTFRLKKKMKGKDEKNNSKLKLFKYKKGST